MLSSQQPQPAPVFRAGVDLVTVDVTVVDKDGQPIRGLSSKDFSVRVDGRQRPVQTLEFLEYGISGASLGVEAAAAPPRAQTSPRGSANRGGRIIVLLFDDLSFHPGEGNGLYVAAERVVDSLDPDDLVGLTTTSGLGPAVSPTRDRRAIVEALRDKRLVGKNDDSAVPFYISTKEAVDFVHGLPGVVKDKLSAVEAERLKTRFDARVNVMIEPSI